ncbi:FG-GAP repeat domain-containing protein [Mucilaginibacter segetis]|nr:VCBS repeat-containing protein [Mucilaginibacter segetis]
MSVASASMLALTFVIGCGGNTQVNTANNALAEGKELSEKYCVSCHQYPSPALLDKQTWENGVLPNMAKQLGIQHEMGQYYADKQSVINAADWQKIITFYKASAPEKLSIPEPDAVKDMALFSVKTPPHVNRKGMVAMTTMIKLNPFDKQIYTADADNNLFKWDKNLNPTLIKQMPSPVTDAFFTQNTGVFTCIGVLPPNDYLKGDLLQLNLDGRSVKAQSLTDSLPRPVQMAAADFNKDGLTDYIVCGFGNTKGGLYLVEQQPGNKFIKKIIRALPGAIQITTGDFNNDGWPDLMCLFAQADEGIWMFLNDHKGGFTSRNILHFPPVYGSNSFQLVDMNNDGKKDIIYTCGDNNDYSTILKPYHGVYIFTNTGNWQFKQTYFYHINGASKVMAADFDNDGDMDLVAIAFFPDFVDHPTEAVNYFDQTSTGKFKVHQLPVNKLGRWIAMEVADVDGDGDQDIVLGNFSIYGDRLNNQKNYKPDWDMYQPIILLQNNAEKQKK